MVIVLDALFDVRRRTDQGVDRETPGGESPEDLALRAESRSFRRADSVTEHGKRPLSRDPRVELAERSRRGVAGIGEGGFSLLFPAAVQFAEGIPFHAHLAPHLDPFRHGRNAVFAAGGVIRMAGNDEGNRGDRPEVERDILAHGSVAARRTD